MAKKSVEYLKEQMTEQVMLGSWKNPRLIYYNISTIKEKEKTEKGNIFLCVWI